MKKNIRPGVMCRTVKHQQSRGVSHRQASTIRGVSHCQAKALQYCLSPRRGFPFKVRKTARNLERLNLNIPTPRHPLPISLAKPRRG